MKLCTQLAPGVLLLLLLGGVEVIAQGSDNGGNRDNSLLPPAERPGAEALESGQAELAEEPAINRRDAALIVEEHYPGRLLGLRLEDGFWRVRLDDAGRVYTIFVDAESGELRESLD